MSAVRWGTVARAGLGAAGVLVPAWVALTRWPTLVAGHPAYPVLLAVLAVVGVVLLLRRGRPGRWRTVVRTVGAVVLIVALAFTVYLRPFAADPPATASTPTVEIVDSATSWELRPRTGPVGTGIVFFPGALVDPRAYLALLRPLAEDGRLVVVVKPPFGVALLSGADAALDAHPEVTRWAVGGHSLGGVAAAAAAEDPRVGGVFFWAAYPNRDLSAAPLVAASITGDRDTVINQARFEEARDQLPPDTAFTVVRGAVHAFFGDYGPQPGDGIPGVDRAAAQREIVTATGSFVAALEASGR